MTNLNIKKYILYLGMLLYNIFQSTVEVLNNIEIQSIKNDYELQKVHFDSQKLFTELEIGIFYNLLSDDDSKAHIEELSLQSNHINSDLLCIISRYLITKLNLLKKIDLSYNSLLSPNNNLKE